MGHKILLADDSITIQKVIELTFSDEDFELHTVGNGQKAIDEIRSIMPHIVLCDIIMPEKNGYEVCEFIKSSADLKHIPVLLLTGAFEPFDQERARTAGCDGFLAKPFEPQTLISKVKELLVRAPAGRPGSRSAAGRAQAISEPRASEPANGGGRSHGHHAADRGWSRAPCGRLRSPPPAPPPPAPLAEYGSGFDDAFAIEAGERELMMEPGDHTVLLGGREGRSAAPAGRRRHLGRRRGRSRRFRRGRQLDRVHGPASRRCGAAHSGPAVHVTGIRGPVRGRRSRRHVAHAERGRGRCRRLRSYQGFEEFTDPPIQNTASYVPPPPVPEPPPVAAAPPPLEMPPPLAPSAPEPVFEPYDPFVAAAQHSAAGFEPLSPFDSDQTLDSAVTGGRRHVRADRLRQVSTPTASPRSSLPRKRQRLAHREPEPVFETNAAPEPFDEIDAPVPAETIEPIFTAGPVASPVDSGRPRRPPCPRRLDAVDADNSGRRAHRQARRARGGQAFAEDHSGDRVGGRSRSRRRDDPAGNRRSEGQAREGPQIGSLGSRLRDADSSWGGVILVADETDSTNDLAASLAKSGAPHGSVVLAKSQSAGRGRWGRRWESVEGGLYLSLVIRPEKPEGRAYAIWRSSRSPPRSRPPRRSKGRSESPASFVGPTISSTRAGSSAGFCASRASHGGRCEFAIVGIGVNVNQEPEDFTRDVASRATSLSAIVGREVDPLEVALAIVLAFEKWWERESASSILQSWRERREPSRGRARARWLRAKGASYPATIVGLADDGGLEVRLEDGVDAESYAPTTCAFLPSPATTRRSRATSSRGGEVLSSSPRASGTWSVRWEQLGIPLSVVKEGIDRVFERPKTLVKPRRLSYCRQTVEAAFRKFREASLGSGARMAEPDESGAAARLAEIALAPARGRRREHRSSRLFSQDALEALHSLEKRAAESPEEVERELAAIDGTLLAALRSGS